MIRMTVRYPYKLAMFNGIHLFIWYLMRESPATKVCTSFDPRISYQHWPTIVANERRIANSFKTYIHCPPLLTAAPNTFEVQYSDLAATPLDEHGDLDACIELTLWISIVPLVR